MSTQYVDILLVDIWYYYVTCITMSPSSVVAKTQIQLSFLSLIVLDVCSSNAEEFDSVAS